MEGVQVGLCRATAHRSLWFSSLEKSENIFRSSTETKKTFLKILQMRVKKEKNPSQHGRTGNVRLKEEKVKGDEEGRAQRRMK